MAFVSPHTPSRFGSKRAARKCDSPPSKSAEDGGRFQTPEEAICCDWLRFKVATSRRRRNQ